MSITVEERDFVDRFSIHSSLLYPCSHSHALHNAGMAAVGEPCTGRFFEHGDIRDIGDNGDIGDIGDKCSST